MRSPSAFYDQFDGAAPFTLIFPAVDNVGPYWSDDGELIRHPKDELSDEGIEAVQVGPDHYRLACRSDGPFSGLRLNWGDEFIALAGVDRSLKLLRVVVPLAYVHHRLLVGGVFNNDRPEAQLVHELGGGWETVAGGMLTLTVPSVRSTEFMRRMGLAQVVRGT